MIIVIIVKKTGHVGSQAASLLHKGARTASQKYGSLGFGSLTTSLKFETNCNFSSLTKGYLYSDKTTFASSTAIVRD